MTGIRIRQLGLLLTQKEKKSSGQQVGMKGDQGWFSIENEPFGLGCLNECLRR